MSLNNEYKWYMVTTVPNKESKVIDSLQNRKSLENLEDLNDFYEAKVPHLTPSGLKRQKNLFPGYIFVQMKMSDDNWFIVRNTQYVTGLVGSSGKRAKPTPVSDEKVTKIKDQVKEITENFEVPDRQKTPFEIGELVKVIAGVAKDQTGKVLEIGPKNKLITIELELFGRKTPTELEIKNVAKI